MKSLKGYVVSIDVFFTGSWWDIMRVGGISCVYRLKRRGAMTQPCGTPLSRVLQRDFLLPMWIWKRRCDIIDIITWTISLLGNILSNLSVRPRCKTMVPYSVICSRKVNKHNARLQLFVKSAFDILCKWDHLILGRATWTKACLFLGKDRFGNWLDAIVD